ncbi:UPF0146 family protein [Halococcus saccharolyticus]|uniref:UPF0146 protein C449_04086 n=1 Tax=Halococcus saccharolyticus DSM 5350 TaxID=1227455 RepID=M0MM92_9EURY|nr:UPF0146 family protein [Halococcus saccharolyticus]EMA46817.1 hypothetical protein C449_04086 [Halococcus saccharolyticus DSM 5350]
MNPLTRALAVRLADFDRLVEVGVGARTGLAGALADTGAAVTATDIRSRSVPDGVAFVCDDVTDPALETYTDADAIYARNLPPELHRPARDLARKVDAAFLFTTLGGEFPTVPTATETLPGGTLFRATDRGSVGSGRGGDTRAPDRRVTHGDAGRRGG